MNVLLPETTMTISTYLGWIQKLLYCLLFLKMFVFKATIPRFHSLTLRLEDIILLQIKNSH